MADESFEMLVNILKEAEFNLYHPDKLRRLLAENGFETERLCWTPGPSPSALVYQVTYPGMTPQTLKVHYVGFHNADILYNDPEQLEELGNLDYVATINRTFVVESKDEMDSTPTRIVLYDYIEGETLMATINQLKFNGETEKVDELLEQQFLCLQSLLHFGYNYSNLDFHDYMVTPEGKLTLTDYNKINPRT